MTHQVRPSDEELWPLIAAGDESAFGRLFDRYSRPVYNHAFRLTASWSTAEDVTQATFLVAWRRRHDARLVDGSALPWLLVVATNAVRSEWRSARLPRLPAGQHHRRPAGRSAQRAAALLRPGAVPTAAGPQLCIHRDEPHQPRSSSAVGPCAAPHRDLLFVVLGQLHKRGAEPSPRFPPNPLTPSITREREPMSLVRATPVLSLAMGVLFLTACQGQSAQHQARATESPSPSASATPDTSIVDALAAAGVSDALVIQLGEVASRTGYGLGRDEPLPLEKSRGFAVVQIATCRDVASGNKTWAQVIATDQAGGAPAADAQTMNDFLRDVFCKAVRPDPKLAATPTSRPSDVAPATDADGTRGLLSSLAWLDQRYRPIAYAPCEKQEGQPLGDGHAWRVSSNVILCGEVLGDTWKHRPIGLTLVFNTPVTEKTAVALARTLLPTDASLTSRRLGSNPDYAAHDGSCASLEWHSTTLNAAVKALNPSWGDGEKASFVLYGKQQTEDGSADAYRGRVKAADVAIGGHNYAQDNTITC
ncbi:sigma factor [Micromonospora sp. SL1-18]|uniref:sigma factor n=1 Tax=Micromonospora sp. SL1-18 TaxID=3399128 RepID=UPI003A4E221D